MNIRAAVPEDASAIAHVHVASWQATYPGIVPQPYIDALNEQDFAERWRSRIETDPSTCICVAEADHVVCGFASGGRLRSPVSPYDGELYAIYLLPAMQRMGVGRGLFAYVAGELVKQEIRHLLVWTLRQNPSTAFYERLGGAVAAEDTLEIGGKTLASVAYGWRDLAGRNWT